MALLLLDMAPAAASAARTAAARGGMCVGG